MAAGIRDWRTGRMQADKAVWAVCTLLGALLLWFGLTKLADAHVPGHEEWNDVLSASKNQYNGQCCGLGDAHLVEFDDWEPWKITINQVNPTGKAIVWFDAELEDDDEAVVRVIIYCFKPLDTY